MYTVGKTCHKRETHVVCRNSSRPLFAWFVGYVLGLIAAEIQ